MPTHVIFENAIISDAVVKASRIAPVKGAAFDKASGILLTVDPATRSCIVKATDTEVFYEQTISCAEASGDRVSWRIPSTLFSGFVTSLPMGEGNQLELIDRGVDSWLRFKAGKKVAKLATLPAHDFPNFTLFASEGLTVAHDLAAKVDQVAWACDAKSDILAGIHIDGERLASTNGYVLCTIPAKIEIQDPVTVPLITLEPLLKGATDLRVRAVEKSFLMCLDADTKATSPLLMRPYPQIDQVMRKDFTLTITCHRQSFLDRLNGLMVLIKADKMPTLRLEVNGMGLIKMLTFDLDVDKAGRIQDTMDVSMDFDGVFDMTFTPRWLEQAIEHTKGDNVYIDMGHEDTDKARKLAIRVRDDQGYICYVMPKVVSSS